MGIREVKRRRAGKAEYSLHGISEAGLSYPGGQYGFWDRTGAQCNLIDELSATGVGNGQADGQVAGYRDGCFFRKGASRPQVAITGYASGGAAA